MPPACTRSARVRASVAASALVVATFVGPPGAPNAGAQAQPPSVTRAFVHLAAVNGHKRVPYSSQLTDTWDVLSLADADPELPGHLLTVYCNRSVPAASAGNPHWEREHLWPRSLGGLDDVAGDFAFADLHHLFPTEPGMNQSRGNQPFGNCAAPDCAVKMCDAGSPVNAMRGGDDGVWQVWPERRGDVARALFYVDVRYEGGVSADGFREHDLVLTDTRRAISSTNDSPAYMGLLSHLIQWHCADPVDDRERRRNDVIAGVQGNRNPFVDRPELVHQVWIEPRCQDVGGPAPTSGPSSTPQRPKPTATRDPDQSPRASYLPVLARSVPFSSLPPAKAVTHTPAPSTTPSPRPTGTATPTPTITPTPSATLTTSMTPTRSATLTPSLTPAPSATPTGTLPPPAQLVIGTLQCETRDEYVRVANVGGTAAQLSGWRILSVVGSQAYTFSSYTLAPGASVYVHSGPDAPPSSGSHLRWTTAYIWNNEGDEAELRTPSGGLVDSDDC